MVEKLMILAAVVIVGSLTYAVLWPMVNWFFDRPGGFYDQLESEDL